MKKTLRTFMIACLLILSSCSNKPITETIYVKQYIPIDLLQISCIEAPAGDTVRSLALSWTNNTGCLRAYKSLVDGIIKNYTEEGVTDEHTK